MIEIREVTTKAQMKDFVMFSFELYKDNPYWVPPLIKEELESFDKTKNPAFLSADAHFYLAYKDNKIVGKVVAIINWDEVNKLGKKKVRFGWFDVINDIWIERNVFSNRRNNFSNHSGSHHPLQITKSIKFFSRQTINFMRVIAQQ